MSIIQEEIVHKPPVQDPATGTRFYDKYENAALEFVNETRQKFGLEPLETLPKGSTEGLTSKNCVIARAIPNSTVGLSICRIGRGEWRDKNCRIHMPAKVEEFIMRWDGGLYPDLIEK